MPNCKSHACKLFECVQCKQPNSPIWVCLNCTKKVCETCLAQIADAAGQTQDANNKHKEKCSSCNQVAPVQFKRHVSLTTAVEEAKKKNLFYCLDCDEQNITKAEDHHCEEVEKKFFSVEGQIAKRMAEFQRRDVAAKQKMKDCVLVTEKAERELEVVKKDCEAASKSADVRYVKDCTEATARCVKKEEEATKRVADEQAILKTEADQVIQEATKRSQTQIDAVNKRRDDKITAIRASVEASLAAMRTQSDAEAVAAGNATQAEANVTIEERKKLYTTKLQERTTKYNEFVAAVVKECDENAAAATQVQAMWNKQKTTVK